MKKGEKPGSIIYIQRLLHLYLDNDDPKISKFRLSQTSDFQTLITQNWSKVLMSLFHILKIWYSELHMALVSCQNLNLSLNDSLLKKSYQKVEIQC